eukprot:9285258-Heterocapsa_arctica.AAC.1
MPRSSMAKTGERHGDVAFPVTTMARKSAFAYEASSTPGGTRLVRRSSRKASSPAGGFCSRAVTC